MSSPIRLRTGSERDFDFLFGHWRIRNRYLVGRLEGSTRWEQFDASGEARPILGGAGNIDSFVAPAWRPGFIGQTLRLFNPEKKQWSIYWFDNRCGTLEPPVVGGFEGGDHGVFYGRDVLRGKTIDVRYAWTRLTPDTARWDQAFSPDGGASWETNWEMSFERAPPP